MTDHPSVGGPLRVGSHYRIHVYRCARDDGQPSDDDQPVATFKREEDAALYLDAINRRPADRPSPAWYPELAAGGVITQYAGPLVPPRVVAMFLKPEDALAAVNAVNSDDGWSTLHRDTGGHVPRSGGMKGSI